MEFAGSNYPAEEEGKTTLHRLLHPHLAWRWIFETAGRKLSPLFLPVFFFRGCRCRCPAPTPGDGPSGGAPDSHQARLAVLPSSSPASGFPDSSSPVCPQPATLLPGKDSRGGRRTDPRFSAEAAGWLGRQRSQGSLRWAEGKHSQQQCSCCNVIYLHGPELTAQHVAFPKHPSDFSVPQRPAQRRGSSSTRRRCSREP